MPSHLARDRGSDPWPRVFSRELAGIERRNRLRSHAAHHRRQFHLRDEQCPRLPKLYAKEELHAGLVIIVPQVLPARQREMFDAVLDELANSDELLNETIEISVKEDALVITRYALPEIG